MAHLFVVEGALESLSNVLGAGAAMFQGYVRAVVQLFLLVHMSLWGFG